MRRPVDFRVELGGLPILSHALRLRLGRENFGPNDASLARMKKGQWAGVSQRRAFLDFKHFIRLLAFAHRHAIE